MPTWEVAIPPSVNRLWRSGRTAAGRVVVYRATAYAAWMEAEALALRLAGARPVPAPVRVAVVVHGGKGFRVNRDLNNCSKALLDLLVRAGVVADDDVRHVVEESYRYLPPASARAAARCVVSVETAEEG